MKRMAFRKLHRKIDITFSMLNFDIPLHVVVDYSSDEIDIITAYIPDSKTWTNYQVRKRGKK